MAEKEEAVRVNVFVGEHLWQAINDYAVSKNVTVSQACAALMAKALKRPELDSLRRKLPGRPPKGRV